MDNGESSYRRFLEGDEDAFGELVKEYRDSLTFFINRYVKDLHTAEDIAIDVFVELLTHPRKYNFKSSVKTWLFMIGRCRALDHIKHNKVLKITELSEAYDIGMNDLEESVLSDERKRVIHEALSKLPEEMRTAVYLVYFADMSYAEAAKVMKKSYKQIDNLLYRAKKELRSILGKEGALLI